MSAVDSMRRRKLSKPEVEDIIVGLVDAQVETLTSDESFQDLALILAKEHATWKFLEAVRNTHEELEARGVEGTDPEEVEELQSEVHCMVQTQLAQRIFALAAAEMYYPQGGRD